MSNQQQPPSIKTDNLPMDFIPHYTSGSLIQVQWPNGDIHQGRVGVSQCHTPSFFLSVGGRGGFYEITPGCRYIGPAIPRKIRCDCVAYLNMKNTPRRAVPIA